MAINMLAAAGFTKIYSILDGTRMENCWKNSGLPWTYDVDPERMKLRSARAGPS